MLSSSLIAVRDDGRMSSSGPRSGGPTSRRSFTSTQKLDHLAAYEVAAQNGQGGAYLRSHGLYLSLISEWRRLRDAGVLAGKAPGDRIGKLTAEQAGIARLRRQLDKAERARVLQVVNCPRFVDLPPIQIYAQLLDEGVYVGSISRIYRVLTENLQ